MSDTGRPTNPDGLVLEAWGQGFMLGSLLIMAAITVCNMRKHILLHKLILAEVMSRSIVANLMLTQYSVNSGYGQWHIHLPT